MTLNYFSPNTVEHTIKAIFELSLWKPCREVSGLNATDKTPMYEIPLNYVFGVSASIFCIGVWVMAFCHWRLIVWPYLWIFNDYCFFGVICLIGGTTRDLSWAVGGNYYIPPGICPKLWTTRGQNEVRAEWKNFFDLGLAKMVLGLGVLGLVSHVLGLKIVVSDQWNCS